MKTILVLHETREGETRVAATPTTVAALIRLGCRVLVQAGAGQRSGFSDWDYRFAGATIVRHSPVECRGVDLVLLVKRPRKEIEDALLEYLSPDAAILGFLDPQIPCRDHLLKYQSRRLTTFSWELLPENSITAPFDALIPMSQISGKAVIKAFMQNASIRDLKGKRVLVLGLGSVGLAAVQEAAQLGGEVVGISSSQKNQALLEKMGCRFFQMPMTSPEAQQSKVRSLLLDAQAPFDLVVCAARRRGQPAPLLIAADVLEQLTQEVEIHDLTASSGGNCAGNKFGETVTIEKAKILNITGYPKLYPEQSTPLYADCVLEFVSYLFEPNRQVDCEVEYCLQSCLTTQGLLTPTLSGGDDKNSFLAQSRKWHQRFQATNNEDLFSMTSSVY